jgi:hypothetical protein
MIHDIPNAGRIKHRVDAKDAKVLMADAVHVQQKKQD